MTFKFSSAMFSSSSTSDGESDFLLFVLLLFELEDFADFHLDDSFLRHGNLYGHAFLYGTFNNLSLEDETFLVFAQ